MAFPRNLSSSRPKNSVVSTSGTDLFATFHVPGQGVFFDPLTLMMWALRNYEISGKYPATASHHKSLASVARTQLGFIMLRAVTFTPTIGTPLLYTEGCLH
jgi:hypothetical protein